VHYIQTQNRSIRTLPNFPYKFQIKLQFAKYDPEVNSCKIIYIFVSTKAETKCSFTVKFQYNFPSYKFWESTIKTQIWINYFSNHKTM